jgi:hypothetical protein
MTDLPAATITNTAGAVTGSVVQAGTIRQVSITGTVSLSLGHLERAAAHWRAALAIFEQYGDHRVPDLRERIRRLETGKAGSS